MCLGGREGRGGGGMHFLVKITSVLRSSSSIDFLFILWAGPIGVRVHLEVRWVAREGTERYDTGEPCLRRRAGDPCFVCSTFKSGRQPALMRRATPPPPSRVARDAPLCTRNPPNTGIVGAVYGRCVVII